MNFTDSIPEVLTGFQTWMFANAASLPVDMQATLAELAASPSPVDRIVKIGECLYTRRGDLDNAGKEQCAQLISIATNSGWHGLQTDGRGTKIVKAICRDVGEPAPIGGWPAPEDDPEAKSEYALPEPPPEEPV